MAVIIFKKIPVLVDLPEIVERREPLGLKLKEKIKELNPLKNFSYNLFLQKVLSKIRILSLKVENKTFHWLQKLREKSKKVDENYWEKLKKLTKK